MPTVYIIVPIRFPRLNTKLVNFLPVYLKENHNAKDITSARLVSQFPLIYFLLECIRYLWTAPLLVMDSDVMFSFISFFLCLSSLFLPLAKECIEINFAFYFQQ